MESRFGSNVRLGTDAIKCAGQFKCKSESNIIHLISAVVNTTDDSLFVQEFPKIVDVESFLRVSAFDVLTDQVDGPLFNGKVRFCVKCTSLCDSISVLFVVFFNCFC